ncbi:hypothetical protein EVAR_57992_1 [Eumeta japonica]|uniref:Uncharacterized protein n=1 Tax=Eumeta variegata TaxID=151549 RepID=A0A4C1Y8F4_EUMVA|nr:hypothetical protein EVAR_57992_1 [Eumeta japonica]
MRLKSKRIGSHQEEISRRMWGTGRSLSHQVYGSRSGVRRIEVIALLPDPVLSNAKRASKRVPEYVSLAQFDLPNRKSLARAGSVEVAPPVGLPEASPITFRPEVTSFFLCTPYLSARARTAIPVRRVSEGSLCCCRTVRRDEPSTRPGRRPRKAPGQWPAPPDALASVPSTLGSQAGAPTRHCSPQVKGIEREGRASRPSGDPASYAICGFLATVMGNYLTNFLEHARARGLLAFALVTG